MRAASVTSTPMMHHTYQTPNADSHSFSSSQVLSDIMSRPPSHMHYSSHRSSHPFPVISSPYKHSSSNSSSSNIGACAYIRGPQLCPHAAERQIYACPELRTLAANTNNSNNPSPCLGRHSGLGGNDNRLAGGAVDPDKSSLPIQLCFECMCEGVSNWSVPWSARLELLKRVVAICSTSTASDRVLCAQHVWAACTSAHIYTPITLSSRLEFDGSAMAFLRESEHFLKDHFRALVNMTDKSDIAKKCNEVLRLSEFTQQIKLVVALVELAIYDEVFVRLLHKCPSFIPQCAHLLRAFMGDPIVVKIAKILLQGCHIYVTAVYRLPSQRDASAKHLNNSRTDLAHISECVQVIDRDSVITSVLLPIFESSVQAALLANRQQHANNSSQDTLLVLLHYCIWALHLSTNEAAWHQSDNRSHFPTASTSHTIVIELLIKPGGLLYKHGKDIMALCLPKISSESNCVISEQLILGITLLHMLFAHEKGLSSSCIDATKPSDSNLKSDATISLTQQVLCDELSMSQAFELSFPLSQPPEINSQRSSNSIHSRSVNDPAVHTRTATAVSHGKALQSYCIKHTDLMERLFELLAYIRNHMATNDSFPHNLDSNYHEILALFDIDEVSKYNFPLLVTHLLHRIVEHVPDAIHVFHYSRFSSINLHLLLDIAFPSFNPQGTSATFSYSKCAIDMCECLAALCKVTSKFDIDVLKRSQASMNASAEVLCHNTTSSFIDGHCNETMDGLGYIALNNDTALIMLLNGFCDLMFRILKRRRINHCKKSIAATSTAKPFILNKHSVPMNDCTLKPELAFEHERDMVIYRSDQSMLTSVSIALLQALSAISEMALNSGCSGSKATNDNKNPMIDLLRWLFTFLEFIDVAVLDQSIVGEQLISTESCSKLGIILAYVIEHHLLRNSNLLNKLLDWLSKVLCKWTLYNHDGMQAFTEYIFADVRQCASLHRNVALHVHQIATNTSATDKNAKNNLLKAYANMVLSWLKLHGLVVTNANARIEAIEVAWRFIDAKGCEQDDNKKICMEQRFCYAYIYSCLMKPYQMDVSDAFDLAHVTDNYSSTMENWIHVMLTLFCDNKNTSNPMGDDLNITPRLLEGLLQLIPRELLFQYLISKEPTQLGLLASVFLGLVDKSALQCVTEGKCPLLLLLSLKYCTDELLSMLFEAIKLCPVDNWFATLEVVVTAMLDTCELYENTGIIDYITIMLSQALLEVSNRGTEIELSIILVIIEIVWMAKIRHRLGHNSLDSNYEIRESSFDALEHMFKASMDVAKRLINCPEIPNTNLLALYRLLIVKLLNDSLRLLFEMSNQHQPNAMSYAVAELTEAIHSLMEPFQLTPMSTSDLLSHYEKTTFDVVLDIIIQVALLGKNTGVNVEPFVQQMLQDVMLRQRDISLLLIPVITTCAIILDSQDKDPFIDNLLSRFNDGNTPDHNFDGETTCGYNEHACEAMSHMSQSSSTQAQKLTPCLENTKSDQVKDNRVMSRLQPIYAIYGGLKQIQCLIADRVANLHMDSSSLTEIEGHCADAFVALTAILIESNHSDEKDNININIIASYYLKAQEVLMSSDLALEISCEFDILQRTTAMYCCVVFLYYRSTLEPMLTLWANVLLRFISTNEGWRCSREGGILKAIILGPSRYDTEKKAPRHLHDASELRKEIERENYPINVETIALTSRARVFNHLMRKIIRTTNLSEI